MDPPRRELRCPIQISQQKRWITSSTTYTTHEMRSGTVASSPDHGSRAPENTFSPMSGSPPKRDCSHGRRHFQILQPLLPVTSKPCTLIALRSPRLQMRIRVGGSKVFLASSIWRRSVRGVHSPAGRPISSHSADSHRSSNPSAWLFTPFPPWQICNLIFSFPLLKDLSAPFHEPRAANSSDSERDEMQTASNPSNPPTFTGSLELHLGRVEPIAHRLLSLPGGIHFRKYTLTLLCGEHVPLITALVEECSHTLGSFEITGDLSMCILHLCSRR